MTSRWIENLLAIDDARTSARFIRSALGLDAVTCSDRDSASPDGAGTGDSRDTRDPVTTAPSD